MSAQIIRIESLLVVLHMHIALKDQTFVQQLDISADFKVALKKSILIMQKGF